MLRSLNEISRIQARPTKDTMEKAAWFLYYAETYPNAIVWYHASKMVLHIDSDAACLVMTESRSIYAGHFYLSYWPRDKPNLPSAKRNGPILTTCKTILNVDYSASEYKTTGKI